MSNTKGASKMSINLIAFLSVVPRSVCMALSICAEARTIVPFAISEGWNVCPAISITRFAPLMVSPAKSTHSRVKNESTMRNGVANLK